MSLGNGGFAANNTPQVNLPIGQQASTSGGLPPGVPSQPYQFQATDTMRGNMHGGGGFYQMPPAVSGQTGPGFSGGTPSWASGLINSGGQDGTPSSMSYIPPSMVGADLSRNTMGGMNIPGAGSDADGGPVKDWLGQLNKYYYDQAKARAPESNMVNLPGGRIGHIYGDYDPTKNYEDLYRGVQMAEWEKSRPEEEARFISQRWNRSDPQWQRQFMNAGDEERNLMLQRGSDQEISGA